LGPYISTTAVESGSCERAESTSGPGPAGFTTLSDVTEKSAPGQGANGVVERHLEGRRADHEHNQCADEPTDCEAKQRAGGYHRADDEVDRHEG